MKRLKSIWCWLVGHRWIWSHVKDVQSLNGTWVGSHGPCGRCGKSGSLEKKIVDGLEKFADYLEAREIKQ